MNKEQAVERLELIIEKSKCEGWNYKVKANDWENYGKSRTYLSIVETRDGSKHYKEKKYGFIDNMTEEYFPEKYGDLRNDYTFGGNNW